MSLPRTSRSSLRLVGGLAGLTAAACLGAVAAPASAIPMRNASVTVNSGDTVGARVDVFSPPTARYCHAFVRTYLLAAGPDDWYVIGRYGKLRVRFSCQAGWQNEGVVVTFSDTGGGTRKICFEAWTPLRSGRQSRHYACTPPFTR